MVVYKGFNTFEDSIINGTNPSEKTTIKDEDLSNSRLLTLFLITSGLFNEIIRM